MICFLELWREIDGLKDLLNYKWVVDILFEYLMEMIFGFIYYHPLWDVWMCWDDICTFEIVMVAIAQ